METKILLTVKTDKRLKAEAQKTAERLGLPLGTVVNAFLKQFVRDQSFTISASYTPSSYLELILDEAERDIAAGRNMSPGFSTAEEAVAYLKSYK